MKNLRKMPPNIHFSDLISDIESKDCTTTFEMDNKNYLNITIPISELLQTENRSVVNRHIPQQTENTYKAFYQYYNYSDNVIKAVSDVKNNYPDSS
jgi:hypothetical protein